MQVTIRLFASFRQGRFDEARLDLSAAATLGEVADGLGIPRAEIGILLVNGRHAPLERRAGEDDTVSIFPLLGGG